jgi:hypothetical protein
VTGDAEERRAAPVLAERLDIGCLGEPHDGTVVVEPRPLDLAVRAAEDAEVLGRLVVPSVAWTLPADVGRDRLPNPVR